MQETSGLIELNQQNLTFLTIFNGYISIRLKKDPGDPAFEKTITVNPETKDEVTSYVKKLKGVRGTITKIERYDRTINTGKVFGGYNVVIDGKYVLQFPDNSIPLNRFMKMARNIDFTQPVELAAWQSEDKKTAFTIKQNGENVPQIPKEDMPAPVELRGGKWSYQEQEQFLIALLEDQIIPNVNSLNLSNEVSDTPEGSTEDQIPF